MKREDLEKIEGLSKEAIDKIMALHGQDIEKHKTEVQTAKTEIEGLKSQLKEAGDAIEGFKKLDVDAIKAAADDWKAKAEKAEADRVAEVSRLKFDHALDGALGAAKARNPKAVKALLDMEALQKAFDEKTGTFIGFDEHLKPIKEANDYLFEAEGETPKIVAKTNNQSATNPDPFVSAFRRGAGLKES